MIKRIRAIFLTPFIFFAIIFHQVSYSNDSTPTSRRMMQSRKYTKPCDEVLNAFNAVMEFKDAHCMVRKVNLDQSFQELNTGSSSCTPRNVPLKVGETKLIRGDLYVFAEKNNTECKSRMRIFNIERTGAGDLTKLDIDERTYSNFYKLISDFLLIESIPIDPAEQF